MASKDRIRVTIERQLRRVWVLNYNGQVEGRPVRGSATAPDLRVVGLLIGGLQRATPSVPVEVHWTSSRPRRPRKGGRR